MRDDKPLAGVSIKLGGSTPTTLGITDAAGNFQVYRFGGRRRRGIQARLRGMANAS